MAFPDLLHREKLATTKKPALSEALTFGFARGVDQERLLQLASPLLGSSTFEKGAFAEDLFISELIKGCFALKIAGKAIHCSSDYFRCLLLAPPSNGDDTRFRQGVLQELCDHPERRALLEKAYLELRAFRDALSGADHFSGRSLGVRRRLDVLIAFRNACEHLLRATGTSESGLERVATWVEEVCAQENYKALVHLLEFENGRAVLEARLQAGYDGTLRRFDITSLAIVDHPPFPRGSWSKFFRRLLALLKGYRFSEEDIMASLLDRIFSDLEEEVTCLLGLSLQLEFYLRGLGFLDLCKERGLSASLPDVLNGSDQSREACFIEGLFNPWLMADAGTLVVPCDIAFLAERRITIVTGPNSGGKTRLLQSLAISQLLAQAGLFVPARRARLKAVRQLFLSLIEHTRPQQSEGRLGLELMRIRQVFEVTGPNSLVLMDELCSGTNPSEGERIFEMVVELLEELGPDVWISTHFLDFVSRLRGQKDESLHFLQVEMNEAHLPTYQFVPGVAETSLARNIATRLGVTREELVELIHRHRLKTNPS